MNYKQIFNLKAFVAQVIVITLLIIQVIFAFVILSINNQSEAAASEGFPQAEATEITYMVKPGDSLYRIADKYKVNLADLLAWNNLSKNSYLSPGQAIIVKKVDYPVVEGLASWYGPNFHGKNMANTEVFNMYDIVVAHRTLPLGREVKITNLENGKSIIAPVLDRGPYVKNSQGVYTREIDLSYKVAQELGTIQKGVVPVRIEPIEEPLVK